MPAHRPSSLPRERDPRHGRLRPARAEPSADPDGRRDRFDQHRYTFVGRDRGESPPVGFYLEHGSGGAGTVGVVLNKMVKRAKDFPGTDVVAGAHHHRNGATTAESVVYDAATGKIRHGSTLCVTVGTFLRYHLPNQQSYGEIFNMDPHGIGPGKVTIRPWAKRAGDRVAYSFPYWT